MSRATRRARKIAAIGKNRDDVLTHNNKASSKEFNSTASNKKDYVDKLLKQSKVKV